MSDHTMEEQYVAELLARLAAARKAQREAELVATDRASEFDHLRAVIRNVLAEPEADDKKLAEGLGTIAWLLRFLVQDSPQPRGLLQAAKEAAKLQKGQLETMSPILYRLNQAAAAAVGLSEHAPEGEILGRLDEVRQMLSDLVGDDAVGGGGLVASAKAKKVLARS